MKMNNNLNNNNINMNVKGLKNNNYQQNINNNSISKGDSNNNKDNEISSGNNMVGIQQMRHHCNQCKRTYKDQVLYGKRCLQAVEVYYDPKDKIFHKNHKPNRHKTQFIQNTKKGFYVKEQGIISQYFYDSYEGWYIRSYYNGFKYNYGCEASAKYRQCDWGLQANTRNYQLVLEEAKK